MWPLPQADSHTDILARSCPAAISFSQKPELPWRRREVIKAVECLEALRHHRVGCILLDHAADKSSRSQLCSIATSGSGCDAYRAIHSSSLGTMPMKLNRAPAWAGSTLSRHLPGCRFLSQKMQAVVSGG
jgi:hypothetical protein